MRAMSKKITAPHQIRGAMSVKRPISTKSNTPDAATIAIRLNHENTMLSWSRNGVISTIAGCAMLELTSMTNGEKDVIYPGGLGMLGMGGCFFTIGAVNQIGSSLLYRHALKLSPAMCAWNFFNALWPISIWALSVKRMFELHPGWHSTLASTAEKSPESSERK